jgi:hypothetical protein
VIAWLPAVLSLAAPPPAGGVFKSAIIVGVNEPFEPAQPTLRWADDDAARFFEMFSGEAEHLELLTLLDADSQSLFASAAERARAPDPTELSSALARAENAGSTAREAGRRTELYFIYTGHGRVRGGEGEVKLSGGVLSRTELTDRVLRSRAFDRIHVIVDACNAYHLVSARGPDQKNVTEAFDEAFDRFVEEHALDRFPSAGFVLSTSGAGATHEWSRYQGGVFSHEIRSALAGAADANEDRRVDYTEMEAFLAAANVAVPDLKGRPKVFVRAPALERAAALFAPEEPKPEVELPASLAGHFFLEDDRGVRYAELNKAEGYAVLLRLVPRERYALVRAGGGEVAAIEATAGLFRLPLPLEEKPIARIERGDEVPPGAFSEPFGPRFVDGFRAAHAGLDRGRPLGVSIDTGPSTELAIAGWIAAGAGLIAAGGAVWQGLEAERAYRRYQDEHTGPGVEEAEARVRAHRNRAVGLSIAGGGLLLAAGTVWAIDFFELFD